MNARRFCVAVARPTLAIRRRASCPSWGWHRRAAACAAATFALGLLRGLAAQGLLARGDYLSTISGGGYVGAMLGRLVSTLGFKQAQQVLAAGSSPVLDWLCAAMAAT